VRPGRAADHSPPSSAAVMEEYSYTSTHPLGHTGPVMGSLYLYLLYIHILYIQYLYNTSLFADIYTGPPANRAIFKFKKI